jgi:hypothetical protein
VVNYLVEGKMTARGILASVLHLADLGLVQLQMGDPLLVTAVYQETLIHQQHIYYPRRAGSDGVSLFVAVV